MPSKKKTDGAWYRANNTLLWLRDPENNGQFTQYLNGLKTDPNLLSAVNGMLEAMGQAMGFADIAAFLAAQGQLGNPNTAAAQLTQYITKGVPRTVWMGEIHKPSYSKVAPGDIYPEGYYAGNGSTQTNNSAHTIYVPNGVPNYRKEAHEFRRVLSLQLQRLRTMSDFANKLNNKHINPGGVADANTNPSDGGGD